MTVTTNAAISLLSSSLCAFLFICSIAPVPAAAFLPHSHFFVCERTATMHPSTGVTKNLGATYFPTSRLYAAKSAGQQLTPLPKDISPFDKSASKGRDIQGDLRKLATISLQRALSSKENALPLLELEFPPLIGGDQSKTQFDDFDSELIDSISMNFVFVFISCFYLALYTVVF